MELTVAATSTFEGESKDRTPS